jgi:hypothetical protein
MEFSSEDCEQIGWLHPQVRGRLRICTALLREVIESSQRKTMDDLARAAVTHRGRAYR